MRKIILIAAISLLIVSCKEEKAAAATSQPAAKAVQVETMTVTKTSLNRIIPASATIRGEQDIYLVAEGGGSVKEVFTKLGDFVKKDQLLVQLDDKLQKAALATAKANLQTAKLNLKIAKELFDSKNSSEIEFSAAESQYTGAETAVVQAEKALENCRITAPFAGYIAAWENSIAKGTLAAPGSPVGRLIDISRLKCQFQIGEFEIGYLKKGMSVAVRIPAAGTTVDKAVVSAVSVGADAQNGTFPVEVSWTNQNLKSFAGMSAELIITTKTAEPTLVLPDYAIVTDNNKKAVFIAEKGKAALRYIETGRATGQLTEVTGGVKENDVLIVSGFTTIKSGDPVIENSIGQTGGK